MNAKGKDAKKRIAHVGSSSSKTVENEGKQQYGDYLASIMEQMDSNDKQIVSYEQLSDYRKSKFKPALPDIDLKQPNESFGSFKLKKKPCPLMAKCQRNLKYIKHNRCIPKPRAHVGSLLKETQCTKSSTVLKKKFDDHIKPKEIKKHEPSRSLSLLKKADKTVSSITSKQNELKDKILKSQDRTETKERKKSKHSKTEQHFSVETDKKTETVPDLKESSSEESDNFESFIQQQVQSHSKSAKRKKIHKKVFKRIKNDSSSESDSGDIQKNSSKVSRNESLVKKTNNLKDVQNDSDESTGNSFQFDFDNECDDSSDSCEANEQLSKTPKVDSVLNFSSNLLNKDINTVEQSDNSLSTNSISGSCLSSSNTADSSSQALNSNEKLNQSEGSLVFHISTSQQELPELKCASEKDQAEGYENDDCVILENSPPDFNIRISAVQSVAMVPTTDEDACVEAVLESNSPQEENSSLTSQIKDGELHKESQQAMGCENEIMASVINITDPYKLVHDESDDCMIIDDDSSSDVAIYTLNGVKDCVSKDTNHSVVSSPDVCHENGSINSIKDAQIIGDSNQKESLASSRYKPDILSEQNVWDVLKEIDFDKLKSLPEQSSTHCSLNPCDNVPNSLSTEKIKSDESHKFIADQMQSSSLPQEKLCLPYSESCRSNSISCNYEDVELINLSDNEDTNQRDVVESTNLNLDFIPQKFPDDAMIVSTSSIGQQDAVSSKSSNFEIKVGDVSSSGVLDDNDLNFHNSLVSNDFTYHKFPLKEEATDVNIPVIKKETASTSDELDISCTESLLNLYSGPEINVNKLLILYEKEYQQYKEILNTGRNLSDGLNLLLNKQVHKLIHIKSAIKNIVKHDHCFKKDSLNVKSEIKPIECDAIVKKEPNGEKRKKPSSQLSDNSQLPDSEHPELRIYTESVLQGMQKVVGDSLPSESTLRDEKVYEQLRNVKCAGCGSTASAACQGCFKVFYCSIECGMSDWENGHSFSCVAD